MKTMLVYEGCLATNVSYILDLTRITKLNAKVALWVFLDMMLITGAIVV